MSIFRRTQSGHSADSKRKAAGLDERPAWDSSMAYGLRFLMVTRTWKWWANPVTKTTCGNWSAARLI